MYKQRTSSRPPCPRRRPRRRPRWPRRLRPRKGISRALREKTSGEASDVFSLGVSGAKVWIVRWEISQARSVMFFSAAFAEVLRRLPLFVVEYIYIYIYIYIYTYIYIYIYYNTHTDGYIISLLLLL